MFDLLLNGQANQPGTLIELGCYLGKSAVIIGNHRRPGERFVVVDLFGSEGELADTEEDEANKRENRWSYRTLTRTQFEDNYLAFHEELPEVVLGLTTEIVKHVEPATARFIHVDASHLYPQVAADIANARTLLAPGGIIALDDVGNVATPGVAAAVWEAVVRDGMKPFALTRAKMYATWDDPEPYLDIMRKGVGSDTRFGYDEERVLGHRLIRVKVPKSSPPPPPPKLSADEIDAIAARLVRKLRPVVKAEIKRQAEAGRMASPARAMAKDLLPPAAVRLIRQARRRQRP